MTTMREVNLHDAKQIAHFLCSISWQAIIILGVQESFREHSPHTSCAKERAQPLYQLCQGESSHTLSCQAFLFMSVTMGQRGTRQTSGRQWSAVKRSRMWTTARLVYRSFRSKGDTKETFLLEEYKHVSVSVNCIT